MRLADAIADTAAVEKQPGKVDQMIDKIHPDDRDEFMAMMLDPSYEHTQLTTWLVKMSGDSVAPSTVGMWRRAKGVRV